jgi:hypothetical protein
MFCDFLQERQVLFDDPSVYYGQAANCRFGIVVSAIKTKGGVIRA